MPAARASHSRPVPIIGAAVQIANFAGTDLDGFFTNPKARSSTLNGHRSLAQPAGSCICGRKSRLVPAACSCVGLGAAEPSVNWSVTCHVLAFAGVFTVQGLLENGDRLLIPAQFLMQCPASPRHTPCIGLCAV